ncbi:DAK2 domain-containing protein [Catenulispora sp. NF23]|uniref:DAK2 domain-containing protein n=1 Tax=Catenulispora pinistramenti TaxID=2705254 RepID=A0ABS5KLW8_9ACTN|nr:DAK2 domain-containing protein [Catenulispora pinistramenti]MBS2531427.1 DAK2 domain-containing protein [Catenulispora pinistramenti]MBS2547035.1 DAK2 domain-containing protein [Catenulispora pinistramenti]
MPPSVSGSAASAAVPPRPDASPVDAGALRRWAGAALTVLGRHREEIDALNVFPIADSDTGTNMYLTFEAACRALDDRLAAPGPAPSVPEALHALAHGALLGARGNSGVILSQLLRGAAAARYTGSVVDGGALAAGLAAGAESAFEAVARPAAGTILSVAEAAAQAASAAVLAIGELTGQRAGAHSGPRGLSGPAGADTATALPAASVTGGAGPGTAAPAPLTANHSLAYVAQAAAAGAREALARTPDQLAVLRDAGVVDAGGLGLVVLLDTLAAYTGGLDPRGALRQRRLASARSVEPAPTSARAEPEFEVIYLLEATEAAVAELRRGLDEFCERGGGDSLVVVGGDGLWRVHVHVDDAGVPLEAGIAAGRPRDIQITHLASQTAAPHPEPPTVSATANLRPTRAIVAVAYGEGIAGLLEAAGAHVLRTEPGRPPGAADFERAVAATRAAEVVLLPNDAETTAVAAAVAERLSAGQPAMRVAAVPAKVTVQGIAALAVHEPARRFDADVVAMTAAAGATRYGAIEVAATEAWTMAGVCRPGQVLGHVENDVALIEDGQAAAAEAVLERMLSAGGEMVTLVVGDSTEPGLPEAVTERMRTRHPVVDVVVYEGGQTGYPLLIGVE